MKPRKKEAYSHGVGRVYLSATLAALSVIMAALLLHNSFYRIAYYAITTAAITAVVYELKNRFTGRTTFLSTKTRNAGSLQPEGRTSWKALFALFLLLFACVIMPLALPLVLPPEAWVILLVSFSTGVSLAEVFFYLSRR